MKESSLIMKLANLNGIELVEQNLYALSSAGFNLGYGIYILVIYFSGIFKKLILDFPLINYFLKT